MTLGMQSNDISLAHYGHIDFLGVVGGRRLILADILAACCWAQFGLSSGSVRAQIALRTRRKAKKPIEVGIVVRGFATLQPH
eukprot:scaffold121171_cov52-Cyclotella_meneghiniana.AAC.1